MTEDKDTGTKNIVNTALERFKLSQDAYNEFKRQAQEDLEFTANDQWEPIARQAREQSGRPCMQIDRINPAIRQIVNESRQNRPAIEIDPTGSGADKDTAAVFGGLIRHIEYDSNADMAYDIAEEYAVKTGLGYFRLIADYEDSMSFEQKAIIKSIPNPMSVFVDPMHKEPDGSDMEWAFIVDDIGHEDFERLYPDSETTSSSKNGGWASVTSGEGWVTENTIRVAEYFYREYIKKKIYQFQNASSSEKFIGEMTDINRELLDKNLIIKLGERDTEIVQVKWLKIAGTEILEETTWPSKYIPIFPVKGEEFWVNGKRFICGAVRRAKDAQRALNYLRSAQIEAVDLAPKAPFIGVAGQFDTFEDSWRDANRKNLAYLEYNSVDVNGNPAPPPQRSTMEPAIQAIMATGGTAVDDLKGIMGIFDASLGAQGNETSGKAIIARTKQSSNSNFHYYDNLVRAIKHLGRVLVDIIPVYYDTERTIRIVKPNGDQQLKQIHTMLDNGKEIDFSRGKYDVVVKTGPSYATKREQMVEHGSSLIQAYPNAGPLIADLIIGASDFEGSEQMAARLRSQVPPDVLAATGEQDGDSVDPKQQVLGLTMQLKQAGEQLKALNAHAQQVEEDLNNTKEELKLNKLKFQGDITKAQMDYNIKAQQLQLEEAQSELEWMAKEREYEIQKEQLEIQKAQLGIKGVQAMADLNDTMHDKTIATISAVKPLDKIEVGNIADPRIGDKFTP